MRVRSVVYGSHDAGEQFCKSLRETGFAVLTNHPISQKLIVETYAEWEKFFTSEAKQQYRYDPKLQSGYFPFRSENAKDYGVKDLKEFFHLFSWTQLPQGLSQKSWELFSQLSTVAEELLQWVDEGTPPEIRQRFSMPLRQMIKESRETLLRILHYPPLTGVEEQGAIRAAAHEDINLITLLPSATAPGLEVCDTKGIWHAVQCDPGSIAVNSGDMLKMATEKYFGSTTHRVVNPSGPEAQRSRYSMPLFLHPRHDVRLSEQHTAGSYLAQRLQEIGLKK